MTEIPIDDWNIGRVLDALVDWTGGDWERIAVVTGNRFLASLKLEMLEESRWRLSLPPGDEESDDSSLKSTTRQWYETQWLARFKDDDVCALWRGGGQPRVPNAVGLMSWLRCLLCCPVEATGMIDANNRWRSEHRPQVVLYIGPVKSSRWKLIEPAPNRFGRVLRYVRQYLQEDFDVSVHLILDRSTAPNENSDSLFCEQLHARGMHEFHLCPSQCRMLMD